MSTMPYHRRYHSDALAGSLALTLEERGALQTILDLIYDRGGPVPDNPRLLAGYMGVSLRKWNSLRASLIEKGKIYPTEDGELFNFRAKKELENAAKTSRKRAENGLKGGRKKAENAKLFNENNDCGLANEKQNVSYSRVPLSSKHSLPPNPQTESGDPHAQLWADLKSLVGTNQSPQIGKWIRDHGAQAVRSALDQAKAANDGKGADHPRAYIATILKNQADRDRERRETEDRENLAFERRWAGSELTDAEARLQMSPEEYARWVQRQVAA